MKPILSTRIKVRHRLLPLGVLLAIWLLGYHRLYPSDWDDGVYLSSAKALASGHRLYSEVFYAQCPVTIVLMSWSFTLFGSSELSIRLVPLLFSLIAIACTASVAVYFLGTFAGYVAGGVLTAYFFRFGVFWTCQAELPALAFGMLAIATSVRWPTYVGSIAAGAAFGLGLAAKFWILPFAGGVILSNLAQGRYALGFEKQWFRRTMLSGVSGMVVLGTVVLSLPVDDFYTQAVQFHIHAHEVYSNQYGANISILVTYLLRTPGIVACALFGFFSAPKQIRAWLFAWSLPCMASLVIHVPLFEHHTLFLSPIFAITIASALLKLIDGFACPRILAVFYGGFLCFFTFEGYQPNASFTYLRVRRELEREDALAMATIRHLSKPDEFVSGDDQGLIFRADRSSSPQLCDTSFVRIRSGFLSLSEALSAARRSRLIVLRTGRLDRLEGFSTWLERSCSLYTNHGGVRIYVNPTL